MTSVNPKVQSFKRNLIIESAQLLFNQHSYEAVTVEDIARTAGFGKSTVYSFFASKEDILHTVIQSGFEYLADEFKRITEADMDTVEALKLLIPLQYGFFLEYNTLVFNYIQRCESGTIRLERQEQIRQMALQKTVHLTNLIQRGIAEGEFIDIDPQYLAWFVISLIKGICSPSLMRRPESVDPEKDIDLLRTVIFEGILTQHQ